jgi:hypothetical protein
MALSPARCLGLMVCSSALVAAAVPAPLAVAASPRPSGAPGTAGYSAAAACPAASPARYPTGAGGFGAAFPLKTRALSHSLVVLGGPKSGRCDKFFKLPDQGARL